MHKLVVLTGAGISAESGVNTFRDSGGLWEGHDVMEVASPQGFAANPSLVLNFYNQRRRQLFDVKPNNAHLAIANLESAYDVTVITQNVDDLHERAGSSNIVHLHGELLKARSTQNEHLIFSWEKDIFIGDVADDGAQIRPHIVWFGESVPMLEPAIQITEKADILLIIGTSMQVYPAASLVHYIKAGTPIYFIDPNPTVSEHDFYNLTIIPEKATTGVDLLINHYLNG
ncbi:MAG: NAD-dependent deacylase [Flavobacteriaceae bacterium]|nr:NAD-dependent deacylase [Flavobacteriaceae bacterium]